MPLNKPFVLWPHDKTKYIVLGKCNDQASQVGSGASHVGPGYISCVKRCVWTYIERYMQGQGHATIQLGLNKIIICFPLLTTQDY